MVALHVGDLYASYHNNREHAVEMISGCPGSQGFYPLTGKGPCFSFALLGEPVADPGNPGYATILFGTLFVRAIKGKSGFAIDDFSYRGGVRECQLGPSCDHAPELFRPAMNIFSG
jgi:hypothetical protein